MIIDLHCHTRKAKQGDSGREVAFEKFYAKIKEAKVKVVAITNHNLFDLKQFEEFQQKAEGVLILPGIELDVVGNKSGRANPCHIIVIVDPKDIHIISGLVDSVCTVSPDEFSISIEDFCTKFGALKNSIITCHYKKTKNITKEDFEYLKKNIDCSNVAVLEPSNARRAGIIIKAEREASWFGSDNHNWDYYPNDNNKEKPLPECAFNITNYNALLSLLKNNQDAFLLKTLLNQKGPERVNIDLFGDLKFGVELYKNVNIVFGGKATGKTEILKDIANHYLKQGKNVSTFYIEDKKEKLNSLLEYVPNENDLKEFRNKNCNSEFELLQNWSWKELPSLDKFFTAKKNEAALAIKRKAKISEAKFNGILDDTIYKEKFNKYKNVVSKVDEVLSLDKKQCLNSDELEQLDALLNKLKNQSRKIYLKAFTEYHSKKLEKYTIDFIGNKITNFEGVVKAPSTYGLIKVYEDKIRLEKTLKTILESSEYTTSLNDYKVGELPAKGVVFRVTKIGFKSVPESIHKEFKRVQLRKEYKETDLKNLLKKIEVIEKSKKTSDYLAKVSELTKYVNDKKISDLMFFVNYINTYKNDFDNDFKPSNGEASILLVDHAINDPNADVVILDEPDSGMGADYINDVLIKGILNQALNNKTIVISTHDPNLVVRTHPYQCIYREEYEARKYKTYLGSSFEEYLINVDDNDDKKRWAATCIEKCEGGQDAILERERTYGHY